VLDDNSGIFKMVDMLTQVTNRSIDHLMARLRREAEKAGQPVSEFVPFFLDSHWNRVSRLLQQATALPDAQVKAAELALRVDRLVGATGRFGEWLPVIEGLVVALDNPATDDRLQVAQLWYSLARCYQYVGDAGRAGIVLSFAEEYTAGQGEAGTDLLRELHLAKGGVRASQLRYEEAEALFRQLLEDAELTGDVQTALYGHDLAAYYFLNIHEPVRAFNHGQQVFVLAIALRDPIKRLRGLHCMAEALRLGKYLGLANRYLHMALEQAQKLNDQPWLAYLEYCFGAWAVDSEDFPAAIGRLQNARSLFKATSNRPGEINTIESLGFALMQSGQYVEAEATLMEAIRGLKEIQNSFEVAQCYYALGMIYARQDRVVMAREAWYEALHQLDEYSSDYSHVQGLLLKLQDAVAELGA